MERGLIRNHELEFALFYRVIDLAIIVSVLALAMLIHGQQPSSVYLLCGLLSCVSFLLASESVHLYRSWRMSAFHNQAGLMLLSWCFAVTSLLVFGYFSKTSAEYSRLVIGGWFVATPMVMLGWRLLVKTLKERMRSLGMNIRRAVIIGLTENGQQLAAELEREKTLGVVFEGFYDDRTDERLKDSDTTKLRGSVAEALELARNGEVDQVYIAMPLSAHERIAKYLVDFSDTTATTYLVPNFFIYNLMHSRWNTVGQVPTLSVYDTPFNGFTAWLKRLEDIVLASVILTLISPLMLVIALGVKFSSPGPIFFKQDRYGLDGRRIKVWKFRSMRTQENGAKVVQATRNDPRVTPFGSFIRRTSLDELPQFINVLQGSMSIVGPRPHAVAHNEQYRSIVSRYMLRHKVKPGITGWAQINGFRGETDTLEKMEKRVEFDLDYIHQWSLWMDIKIVFLTIFKGFVGKTAY